VGCEGDADVSVAKRVLGTDGAGIVAGVGKDVRSQAVALAIRAIPVLPLVAPAYQKLCVDNYLLPLSMITFGVALMRHSPAILRPQAT
jgi:hypothetical protein